MTSPALAADTPPPKAAEAVTGVGLDDFYAYMPAHSFIFAPSREMWAAASVNARIQPVTVLGNDGPKSLKASAWLDENRHVEQMTWAPGYPMVIPDRLVSDGGWIQRPGCSVFNLYRPPLIELGDPSQAGPWIEHVRRVYPDEAGHIELWCGHRVQRPYEKLNHALVIGGGPGIGKDTIFEPVKHAVGPWNFAEVSPTQMTQRFNGFLKSVILRVSEARDLGDVDRYAFYEHSKTYIAAPPDVLRVDEKNLREHSIFNVCGVVITTNYKTTGIYLPPDDRRHFVAWSPLTQADFSPEYWTFLYQWFTHGGAQHVAAYLAGLDISDFDPKAPPPKTAAFWDIVDANRAPEDAELADVLDKLGDPVALTLTDIAQWAGADFTAWLRDRRNSRQIPHRMEAVGYVAVRNPGATDGKWKLPAGRQVVYAKRGLSLAEQIGAARARVEGDR